MGAAAPFLVAGGSKAATEVLSSYGQARAMRAQGRYENRAARMNAQLAFLQAEDAVRRGDVEEAAQRRRTKVLLGAQRAAQAGQGLDLGFGSPLDVSLESGTMGAMDALTIRNNAYREAFGFRLAGQEALSRGRMARIATRSQARSTLIAGGMRAASSLAQGFQQAGQAGYPG